MALFGRRDAPRPTAADLRADSHPDTTYWGGLEARVGTLPPWRLQRQPTPVVLFGGDPLVVRLDELEQLALEEVGIAESPAGYATAFVATVEAAAPTSAVADLVTEVPPGHVVVVADRDGTLHLDAVLTRAELNAVVTWARDVAASRGEVPAEERP